MQARLVSSSNQSGLFTDSTKREVKRTNSPDRASHTFISLRPRRPALQPAQVPAQRQASENVRHAEPAARTAHQKQRRTAGGRAERRLSKEFQNSATEPAEVLALLVPSKQRSYRIALSKQAISQTSGCARLDAVSATSKKKSQLGGQQTPQALKMENKIQNCDSARIDQTPDDVCSKQEQDEQSPRTPTRYGHNLGRSTQLGMGLLGKRNRQPNRVRKDEGQIQLLIQEFKKCPDWTKEQVTELSANSGLTESQVYKWAWDQKKKLQQTASGLGQYLAPDQLEKLQKSGKKNAVEKPGKSQVLLGQAEVTRDEFGGYCCKRWGTAGESQSDEKKGSAGKRNSAGITDFGATEQVTEENICKLLNLDIEKSALEIVKADFKRKKIPLSKAGKYLNLNNPHSAHTSAAKSFNASATKSATKPSLHSGMSGAKDTTTTTPSAFLCYDSFENPYKRSRVDSHTQGAKRLFPPRDGNTSAQSKKSAKVPSLKREGQTILTPLNNSKQVQQEPVDLILDDDFDIPATSAFNHGEEEENLFKTPSPSATKKKFDLSELDEKQKPFIPEATMVMTQSGGNNNNACEKTAEIPKEEKPAKISKKKRKFAAMIGGETTAADSAAITPMQEPALPPQQSTTPLSCNLRESLLFCQQEPQQSEARLFLEDHRITPSDQKNHFGVILSGAIMKTQLTPLQNKRNNNDEDNNSITNDQLVDDGNPSIPIALSFSSTREQQI